MLIFSIFASEWGSGRKYLKNEGRPPQAQRGKRKGNGKASPSPSKGGDVPGRVGLQRVVECEKYCRSAYFSLLIGCFYEGKNHKETMKLPFWIVVERNKGKGGWGLPKPLRRRGCAWRGGGRNRGLR